MDDPGPLPDVVGVLEDLNREFGWAEPDAQFFVVRFAERPRSTLYMVSSVLGGDVDVLVKGGRQEWDGIRAADVANVMIQTADAIGAAGLPGVSVPAPLAWTDSPKLVVSRYIDGVDLSTVLGDPEHPLWDDASGTLEKWLYGAGSALAAYHRNSTVDVSAYSSAVQSVSSATTRLLIRPRTARPLLPDSGEHLHARRYLEPNPSNWRLGDDGTVWLLDPPLDTRFAFVHEDLAHFLNQAEKILRSHAHMWRFLRIREAFLGGYDSIGPSLDSPRDVALLELFRARFLLGVVRATSRHRTIGHTARQLAIAWQARRRTLHQSESRTRA